MLIFLIDTVYAVLTLIPVFTVIPSQWSLSYSVFLWVGHTIKSLVLTYLVIKLVLSWSSTVYYVTETHLVRKQGVLKIQEDIFQLGDIESVGINQSWFGRLFGFGDVMLTFSIARQKVIVVLYAINNPQEKEAIFSKYV